jgi:hypothetical protein
MTHVPPVRGIDLPGDDVERARAAPPYVRIGTLPESSCGLNAGKTGSPARLTPLAGGPYGAREDAVPDDHATPQPRLPDSLSGGTAAAEAPRGRGLRAGCHLLRFAPRTQAPLGGTLRVEREGGSVIASGDLYLQAAEPDPSAGIPVFPRDRYRAYLRVTRVSDGGSALGLEVFDFDHAAGTWLEGVELSAHMSAAAAPDGFPSREDFLQGEVRDLSGSPVGELAIGWISPHVRRAVIELDRVAESESPLANTAGLGWSELFESIGWQVTVEESDADLVEESGESWSSAELHAEMLSRRSATNLDDEWRYWLVSVRRLDDDERGLMFDRDASDSNHVPREAAAIASHWTIPDDDPWGLAKGLRFGSAPDLYFRTATHEIGHALGLEHASSGVEIMCPTLAVAERAVAPQQFPENVEWTYSAADRRRLCHMPDHWVRPGGVPFGAGFGSAPRLPGSADAEPAGLELTVSPVLATVPIGAPVRLDLTLRNAAGGPVPAPADLSLKSGHMHGTVTDPSGVVRPFRPLLRYTEPRRLEELPEGGERTGSLTLLRGAEGALFPTAGDHAIDVRIDWERGGAPRSVTGSGTVSISPAVDGEHAEAARRILAAPDALLTLVLGGDHLTAGLDAVRAGLANDVLRPHYAYVEARRIASRFRERPPDLPAAAELIDVDTVMSAKETDKVASLVAAATGRGETPPERLVAVLRERAADHLRPR